MKEIRVNDKVRTTDFTSSSYERFRLETGINRGAKDHRGFFSGFHTKDSSSIKKTVSEKVILRTTGTKKDGSGVHKTEDFGNFLRSMGSIPGSVDFQERILSFKIQVDGFMANAWTSDEFYYAGSFSHCGVNSFQLFKDGSDRKIIYLIDTRRKEGCDQ